MKKFIALLLSVVMLVSFGVTALAANNSPIAPTVFKVTVINGANAKPVIANYDGSGNLVLDPDPDAGDFDSWTIYKADGVKLAVENEDYIIVEGSLTTKHLVITPLAEIIVCGNYNKVVTNPLGTDTDLDADDGTEPDSESDKGTDKDDSNKAPQTGDNTVYSIAFVMMAVLGLAVVAKKKITE